MFENSKVQKDGKLLTVYHGTNGKFKKFSKSKIGSHTDNGVYGKGFYFTDDKNQTYKYGKNQLACHINIENPLVLGHGGEYDSFTDYSNKRKGVPEIRNREDYEKYGHLMATQEEGMNFLKKDGYDGIIIHPYNGAETEYVVFEPEQIEIIGQIKENLTKLEFKPNIQVADSLDSLKYYLKNNKKDCRILIDTNKNLSIISDVDEVHYNAFLYTVNEGWYGNIDEEEYWEEHLENGDLILLIFSKDSSEEYLGQDGFCYVFEYPFGYIYYREYILPNELLDTIGPPTKTAESEDLDTGLTWDKWSIEKILKRIPKKETALRDKISKMNIENLKEKVFRKVFNLYYLIDVENMKLKLNINEEFSNSANIYEQKAYHGTNAKFDKFDLDKIKDWRYGYGIYFTRSKGYASNYGEVGEYEVPDNEYLLSWEDSYKYQSEYIQDILYKIWKDTKEQDKNKIIERAIFSYFANDGEAIYYAVSEALKLSGKATSEFLYKYGIKGIDSFKGDCIVIFHPDDIIQATTIYESFGLKTGMAHYDKVLADKDYAKDKHTFYEKIKMSPDAYIDACASGFRLNMYSTNYRKLYDGRVQDRETIEHLKEVIQNGEMDVPVLSYYYYKSWDCNFEQEGIHRAIAAKELGYKEIPVIVFVAPATHHDDSVTDEFLLKELAGYIRKYNRRKTFYEVVYHGSDNLFKAFKKDYIGTATEKEEDDYHKSAQHGFFFTDDEEYANNYGKYVYACELSIKNPLVVDMSDYMATDEVLNNFINQAKEEGKDGVIFKNIRELGRPVSTEYVVFEPNQIKSVDNKGTWNPASDNIYETLNKEIKRYL